MQDRREVENSCWLALSGLLEKRNSQEEVAPSTCWTKEIGTYFLGLSYILGGIVLLSLHRRRGDGALTLAEFLRLGLLRL